MDWPLTRYSIVAVVAIDAAEDAVPLARALLAGGVSTVEVTMRTPAALDAIAAIAADVPEIGIGAGTVLDPDHCAAAVDRGARFAVAPGLNPAVVEAAAAAGLPFAPGVATPSELDTAIRMGCRVVKFFPAAALGGTRYLKAVSAPYRHLGVRFVPTGGGSIDNLEEWLQLDEVEAVGGTWLARSADISSHRWDDIEERARKAVAVSRRVRPLSA